MRKRPSLIAGLLAGAGLLAWPRLRALWQRPAFLVTKHKPGTALITGASSGIGATFARHLAARGYDLILVARREDRLVALAAELQQRHPIQAEVLAADLARTSDIKRVEQRLARTASLSILINNAGFGLASPFSRSDLAKELDMIQVHLNATVRLSRAAIPGMVGRRRGAIINLSSVAAFFPTPGATTYCASKSYLKVFSEALQGELEGSGVQVQALCPGFTRTEFHYTPEYQDYNWSRIPKFFWMSTDEVVAESLRALERGQVVCIPGLGYRLLVGVAGNPLLLSWLQPVSFRLQRILGIHR